MIPIPTTDNTTACVQMLPAGTTAASVIAIISAEKMKFGAGGDVVALVGGVAKGVRPRSDAREDQTALTS
jgi:hypothetical protein